MRRFPMTDSKCECDHVASAHEHGKPCSGKHFVAAGNYSYDCFCRKCPHEVALAASRARVEALHKAMIALASWVPEQSRPTDYAKAFGWPVDEQDNGAPFLSETFLYPMLGKDDARTLLYYWRQLAKASGVPWDEVADQPAALAAAEDDRPERSTFP
jgi:hypothetical protein